MTSEKANFWLAGRNGEWNNNQTIYSLDIRSVAFRCSYAGENTSDHVSLKGEVWLQLLADRNDPPYTEISFRISSIIPRIDIIESYSAIGVCTYDPDYPSFPESINIALNEIAYGAVKETCANRGGKGRISLSISVARTKDRQENIQYVVTDFQIKNEFNINSEATI